MPRYFFFWDAGWKFLRDLNISHGLVIYLLERYPLHRKQIEVIHTEQNGLFSGFYLPAVIKCSLQRKCKSHDWWLDYTIQRRAYINMDLELTKTAISFSSRRRLLLLPFLWVIKPFFARNTTFCNNHWPKETLLSPPATSTMDESSGLGLFSRLSYELREQIWLEFIPSTFAK